MAWYLQLNFILAIFGATALLASALTVSAQQKMTGHYLMLLLTLLLTQIVVPLMALWPPSPYEYPINPVIRIPIQGSMHSLVSLGHSVLDPGDPGVISTPFTYDSFLVCGILFAVFLLLFVKTSITLKKINQGFLFKKIGSLQIIISDENQSPYAFSLFYRSFVVMPQFLLKDMSQFQLALQHELQHLRRKDPFGVYMFEAITYLCFLNPMAHMWRKQMLMDQEFACDESLIAQNKVPRKAYAMCLFHVADNLSRHKMPFGTTGMAWRPTHNHLSRRIEKMKEIKSKSKKHFYALVILSLALFGVSAVALQDTGRSITLSQLQSKVDLRQFGEFPVELNEPVLKELNRFYSNRRWRTFSQEAVDRYKVYKPMIDSIAKRHSMPEELAAVAFIESGFVNEPDRRSSISSVGAGIWQFVPATARNYGLVVNSETDERFDISLATDAAIRYLRDNTLRLNDVRLALMAYYVGENRVLSDIVKYQTRDPWELIERGHYKTPYLARVMAGALLLKHPNLLDK